MINDYRDIDQDEKLKLKYMDCFMSRYIYYNSTRFFSRFG